jgi:hypothetical protein
MMYNRIAFLVVGILLLIMGIFLTVAALIAKTAPIPQAYTVFSMSIMCFCLSYLFPQFIQKDERMKLIRQKGMFFSFFAFLFYSSLLNILIQFDVIHLSALEAINIITALMISTVFISWVILARIY